MGANAVNTNSNKYYKPMQGYIVTKPTGSESETIMEFDFKSLGKFKYAVSASIDGIITLLEIKKDNYGTHLNIHMMDGPDSWILTTKHDTNAAFGFYAKMKSIDYRKAVQFVSWKPKDDKYYKMLVFQQDEQGEWADLPYAHAMESVPRWGTVEVNGDQVVDKGPSIKFYMKDMAEVMKSIALYGNTAKPPVTQPAADTGGTDAVTVDEEDDLPF